MNLQNLYNIIFMIGDKNLDVSFEISCYKDNINICYYLLEKLF